MKVIDFPNNKLDADEILKNSMGKFEEAIVCGYTAEGQLLMIYNTDDIDLLYTMISRARQKLLEIGYDDA